MDLDSTIGAMVIGAWVSCFLWSAEMYIAVHWYLRFPNDSLWLRAAVLAVAVTDTVQMAIICASIYRSMVTGFGNFAMLADPSFYPVVTPILSGVTSAIVTVYLLVRYWRVSRNTPVSVLLGLSIVAYEICLLLAALASCVPSLARYLEHFGRLYFGTQALTDAALTAALIYTLLSHIKTEIERTKNLLWRLICVALETGLLTTLGAIACLIASLAAPTTLISIAIALPLPHLYGLSLLINLNLRGRGGTLDCTDRRHDVGASGSSFRLNTLKQAASAERPLDGIHMEHTTHVQVEEEEPRANAAHVTFMPAAGQYDVSLRPHASFDDEKAVRTP